MDTLIYDYETISVTCACATACFSGLVVLTCIFFPAMLYSHFMRLIATISVCDFLGSLLLTVGFPMNGSLCEAQGFFFFFFSRGSWFFTVVLSIQLYCLLIYSKLMVPEVWVHVICWGTNIILAMVVFAHASYGSQEDDQGTQWCQINDPDLQIALDYVIAVFLAPVIICSFLLIIITSAALLKSYVLKSVTLSDRHWQLLRIMLLYPTCMIVSWLPNILSYFIYLSYNDDDGLSPPPQLADFNYFSQPWGVLYGSFLSVVFFVNSSEARRRWYNATIGRCVSRDQEESLPFHDSEKDPDILMEQVYPSDEGSRISSGVLPSFPITNFNSSFSIGSSYSLERKSALGALKIETTMSPESLRS